MWLASQALQAVRVDRQRWLGDSQQQARGLAVLAEAVLRFESSREGRVWHGNNVGGEGPDVIAAQEIKAPALVLELGQASVKLTEASEKARFLGPPHSNFDGMHRRATYDAP